MDVCLSGTRPAGVSSPGGGCESTRPMIGGLLPRMISLSSRGQKGAAHLSFLRWAAWVLAAIYFRGASSPTIIDVPMFHFRVRDGTGWDHWAVTTRLQSPFVSLTACLGVLPGWGMVCVCACVVAGGGARGLSSRLQADIDEDCFSVLRFVCSFVLFTRVSTGGIE